MIYDSECTPSWLDEDLFDRIMTHADKTLCFEDNDWITVSFTHDEESCGCCDEDDGLVTVYIRPDLSREESIATIFHELVHAKQILTGILTLGEGLTLNRWHGIIYTCTYEEYPWEVEAYAIEKQLVRTFDG